MHRPDPAGICCSIFMTLLAFAVAIILMEALL